jgi:hypothetical protein
MQVNMNAKSQNFSNKFANLVYIEYSEAENNNMRPNLSSFNDVCNYVKSSVVSTNVDVLTLNRDGKNNQTFQNSCSIDLNRSTMVPNSNDSEKKRKKSGRMDRRGVPIVKGGKKHRVTFSDGKYVNQVLVERIKIESYKQFNISNKHEESKLAPSKPSGSCCLTF